MGRYARLVLGSRQKTAIRIHGEGSVAIVSCCDITQLNKTACSYQDVVILIANFL